MKVGFVNIFGRPNAGKSTLLNALLGEKLAIVSPKVQTTRHRIKGILNDPGHQIILSDTPGIIEPKYKLHERMMQSVKSALEDADVALLLVDANDDLFENEALFASLKLKVPCIVVVNKCDTLKPTALKQVISFFQEKPYARAVIAISALAATNLDTLLKEVESLLPEGEPFFEEDQLT
ncbi:MAG: GTPase Era, partial [Bacteroidetes bacterium]|nr:GTPase Era [Bacteroidota bacterium]